MSLRTLLFIVLLSSLATSGRGGTLNLSATANDGSRFISHSFGGLFELGRTRDSTRVEEADGAFYYSELPEYVPLGGGGTAFPHKNNFLDLGRLEYDDATGEITDLETDFAPYVAPGTFTYYQAVAGAPPYTTSFNSYSGTVSFNGFDAPTINLTSEIVFSVDGSGIGDGVLTYVGAFNVVDNAFELAVDHTALSQAFAAGYGDGDIRLQWSVSGTLGLRGDFNHDGSVDAVDYAVWRTHLGSSFDLHGNGDETGESKGVVDSADFDLWSNNFGANFGDLPADGALESPEPTSVLLAAVVWGAMWLARRSDFLHVQDRVGLPTGA